MSVSNVESCALAYQGDLGTMKMKFGTDTNAYTERDQSKRMALHWACSASRELVVEFLLNECNVPVDVEDDASWTPLMIATSVGNIPIVEMLLAYNANVNCVNETGNSALHYAASKDRLEIVELLIKKGSNLNVQDYSTGATPLHRAASRGHSRVVKFLIASQAAVNVSDKQGNCALHLACEEERTKECELLVLGGASIHMKNKEEKSPLDVAPPYLSKRLQAMELYRRQENESIQGTR